MLDLLHTLLQDKLDSTLLQGNTPLQGSTLLRDSTLLQVSLNSILQDNLVITLLQNTFLSILLCNPIHMLRQDTHNQASIPLKATHNQGSTHHSNLYKGMEELFTPQDQA